MYFPNSYHSPVSYSITNSYNSAFRDDDKRHDDDYHCVNQNEDIKNDNEMLQDMTGDDSESEKVNLCNEPESACTELWNKDSPFINDYYESDDDVLMELKKLNAATVILQKLSPILNDKTVVTYEHKCYDMLEDLMITVMTKMHFLLFQNNKKHKNNIYSESDN